MDVATLETGQPPSRDVDAPPMLGRPPRRRVGERVSLGHVVMVAAALLAFVLVVSLLADRAETVTVATAAVEILPGTTVTDAMVREVELPADSELVGSLATLGDIEAGRVTAGQRIAAGEPISLTALAPASSAPSGLRAMSIPIDREHAVGGDLTAGDRIDVISVLDGTATYIATDLEVLGTQRSAARSGALSTTGAGRWYVVVAVDDQTALGVALAIGDAEVSVLRSTGAQAVNDTERTLTRTSNEDEPVAPGGPGTVTDPTTEAASEAGSAGGDGGG